MKTLEQYETEVNRLEKVLHVLYVLFPLALIAVAIYSFIKI